MIQTAAPFACNTWADPSTIIHRAEHGADEPSEPPNQVKETGVISAPLTGYLCPSTSPLSAMVFLHGKNRMRRVSSLRRSLQSSGYSWPAESTQISRWQNSPQYGELGNTTLDDIRNSATASAYGFGR